MSILKNSLWNSIGFMVPTLIAMPAMGVMSRVLGVELFGFITVAFALVGYASFFDMGMTRAVIRAIAICKEDINKQVKVIHTALLVVVLLGCTLTFILLVSKRGLVGFLNVSEKNFSDVEQSIALLIYCIPVTLLTQVLLARNEGVEEFRLLAIQKMVSGTLLVVTPLLFLWLQGATAYAFMIGLSIARFVAFIMAVTVNSEIIFRRGVKVNLDTFLDLVKFGGWVTVSNVVSPILTFADRFVISNMLGGGRVAYYTGPSEAINRAQFIPSSISRALFPVLSAANGASVNKDEVYWKSYKFLFIVTGMISVILFIFSKLILITWLGAQYGGDSVLIFQILIVGFFINSLAQMPFSAIQAAGKSQLTAALHLSELIPYLLMLYFLLTVYGLIGAAYAYVIRISVDYLLLEYFASRLRSKNG